MEINKIVKNAMLSFLVLSAAGTVNNASAAAHKVATPDNMEKCYGIVKAGMNDCQTATASCAGSSTKDSQKDAFIFLPKGTCTKLVAASLKPKADTNK